MKVVLFCGGLGTRMRGHISNLPKPLVNVGNHALVWHVMKYYASHGHADFILCLGYGAPVITSYFRERGEEIASVSLTGRETRSFLMPDDGYGSWTVTLVDTGPDASIGQRLRAVREHVAGEELFLANYADGLTSLPLDDIIDLVAGRAEAVGGLVAVKPTLSFHYIHHDADGRVLSVESSTDMNIRINGGYFVFRPEIFDYIGEDDELVEKPFERLIGEGRLLAYPYDGFWRACDTLKDVQLLEEMQQNGRGPWDVARGVVPIRPAVEAASHGMSVVLPAA